MASAQARHILVSSSESAEDLKRQIAEGADFGELAAAHSQCPSGQRGGDLGVFGPGQMVRDFDEVVFSGTVGEIHGPIQTQFGYHLIDIVRRDD